MPIAINGSGTITGISAGGLPDGCIVTADLDSAVPVAKAWVNFDGTGTVAIRASYNVSSITDNGTGRYAVNFTTAMVDANYSYTYGGKPSADNIAGYKTDFNQTNTSSSLLIQTGSATAAQDFTDVCVAIFR
jgi:hypothetical protein